MQKHNKQLLAFLALPFIAFAAMIGQGVIEGSAPRFTLPVQGFDPRDILYGHYMNLRIHGDILTNTKGQCACIGPSASTEKAGYQNSISYVSCAEAKQRTCIAVIDGNNPKHIKALTDPARIYIEESLGGELDTVLRKEPQRLEIEASLSGDVFKFHGLYLDGKPIKAIYASDPFDTKSWGK